MRGRRFASKQDIERHIANGFGGGAGAGYLPWLRVQDVPSISRGSYRRRAPRCPHARLLLGVGRKKLELFEVQQTGALKYPYFGPDIIRRRDGLA